MSPAAETFLNSESLKSILAHAIVALHVPEQRESNRIVFVEDFQNVSIYAIGKWRS